MTDTLAATAGALSRERPLLGIALILAGFQVVPLIDGIAKYLAAYYPVLEVAWARFFFHSWCIVPVVVWHYGWRALWPPAVGLQLLRGLLLLGATILFFGAIAHIPIVDALALVFISPLVVTALSPLVLGEPVGLRRASAVLVGFAGVLIVLRPGGGVFHWASLLALGTGVCFACYLLLTRKLSGRAPALVTLGFTALVGAAALSLAAPWYFEMPQPRHLLLMLAIGAVAAAGHWLIIMAFDYAPAALLAPFSYSEIFMGTLVGWLLFGDFPDAWTWAGIVVIVASGLYIWLREQRLARHGASGLPRPVVPAEH